MSSKKPICSGCNSNANMVKHKTYYRCAFCDIRVRGQTRQIAITEWCKT